MYLLGNCDGSTDRDNDNIHVHRDIIVENDEEKAKNDEGNEAKVTKVKKG